MTFPDEPPAFLYGYCRERHKAWLGSEVTGGCGKLCSQDFLEFIFSSGGKCRVKLPRGAPKLFPNLFFRERESGGSNSPGDTRGLYRFFRQGESMGSISPGDSPGLHAFHFPVKGKYWVKLSRGHSRIIFFRVGEIVGSNSPGDTRGLSRICFLVKGEVWDRTPPGTPQGFLEFYFTVKGKLLGQAPPGAIPLQGCLEFYFP